MAVALRDLLPRHRQGVLVLGSWLAAAVAGLAAGVVGARGQIALVAIFAGLVIGAAVLSSRRALLWFVIIGGIVVTGLAQLYLPGARYLRYIVPLASLGLILHVIMDHLGKRTPTASGQGTGIIAWSLAFLLIALISTVINFDGLGVPIMGLKGFFQMWAFFFGLMLVRWNRETVASLPKGMLVIALLQLPFALHQYLVLVPGRVGLGSGIVPVDVVSGTFGGNMYGGGANAVLTAFLLIALACVLGLWKHGALSRAKTIVLSLVLLSPIFVTGAKISALYLPVIFITLFYRDMVARPVRFLLVGAAMIGLWVALLTALAATQPSGRLNTWSDVIDFTIERQTASMSERRGQYSELSRWTALTFWAGEHVSANPIHTLVGHGPGASRVQEAGLDLATTLAEDRYRGLQIGYTAVSALLWDTGVLGLAAVLALFVAAFRTAGWLSHYYRQRDSYQAGLFDGLRAGIPVLLLSLAHKDFFVVNIPFQTLVLLILGYLVVARTYAARPALLT